MHQGQLIPLKQASNNEINCRLSDSKIAALILQGTSNLNGEETRQKLSMEEREAKKRKIGVTSESLRVGVCVVLMNIPK